MLAYGNIFAHTMQAVDLKISKFVTKMGYILVLRM